jgi:ABC-type dipeptide/oligopeptide/nickel transport system ATPase subunit
MSEKVTPIRRALRDAGSVRGTNGNRILPEDCPVTPLGHSTNPDACHYLNALGQYTTIPDKAHSKLTIYGLFGARAQFLIGPNQWGKGWDEDRKQWKDFAPDKVARDLIAACHDEGPWNNAADRLRGRGAWRGEDDDLILHLGTTLLIRNQVERPGKRDRYVYTVSEPRPGPAPDRQAGGDDGPAAELERLLRCWHWSRTEGLDARLLLGWVCAGFVCGALEWRPQAWISGPPGSGKTTLTRMLSWLFGRGEGCVVTEDASAAGVRTFLQHDSLPVFFDESEPSEDPRRLNALIDLARLAASGGIVLRGTQDHGSASFTVRFMGLFSSVLRPPLKGQDATRIAVVNLRPHDGKAPLLREDMIRALGRRLHRRMVDGWPRFLETYPLWRKALMDAGLDSRGGDQFGAILAAADVALHDDTPGEDTLANWASLVVEQTRAERAEQMPEWRRALEHVTSKQAPQWRGGELQSIGRLIAVAAQRQVLVDQDTGEPARPGRATADDANRVLASVGLRVVPQTDTQKRWLYRSIGPDGQPVVSTMPNGDLMAWLAVANNHTELSLIFRGTHWQTRSGADGGWKPALQEAPGAIRHKEMRFGGMASRCVLVPLELVLDGDGEADGE